MKMQNIKETITAIATSLTPQGIGIIRISGEEAFTIASNIFVTKNKNKIDINETHKVKYGFIYDENKNEFIDEVLLIPMKAPHSYTAEDVIEIQCHGGVIVLKRILNLILEKGARLAEPGEFTKRAFLNGRIDLSKAESVADLINAKNEYARKASLNELKGEMSNKINEYRKIILEDIAFIEAALDDPEHIEVEGFKDTKLKNDLKNIKNDLLHLINNYDSGRIIKEGINTCIVGKPNVGKSSLLNTLLNEERAIVTDIAGTTRDIIRESINLRGITINIIDTAGIRNEENIDTVENIGIEKAKEAAINADLVLMVLDSTKDIDDEDKKIIDYFKNKKIIYIMNKSDLLKDNTPNVLKELSELYKDAPSILFSTKTKEGLKELTDTIEKMFINNEIDFNSEVFINNERNLELIKNALTSINNVVKSIDDNISEDFLTIDLNDAYTYLSKVLGEEVDDDLVNEIFSKFCMGK